MEICPLCHNEMKLFPGEWQPLYFCPNEACRFFTEKLTVKAISFLNEHLARQSAIIAAQAELIEAHDEYLLAADDVAEIKWGCVGGHPVPEELRERLQLAYERRKSARAKLAEVQNG